MSKQRFLALAARHGIQVEYNAGRASHPRTGERIAWEITLDSPPGKIFAGSGCHVDCCLRGHDSGETSPSWAQQCKNLQTIIDDGLLDCEDPECETCHPEE